jgi:23S rRNA (uracil1939-C5)-methyltransferase
MAELTIARIASGGDGAATLPDGGTVFVAFTLPGERITAAPAGPDRATLDRLLAASPDRVAPPCPHFGVCGGCALQHWADAPYARWKENLLRRALAKAGFPDADVGALRRTPPHMRRRMDFAAAHTTAGLVLGLHVPRSRTVMPIADCQVLHPALQHLLPKLRATLASLDGLRRQAGITANLLDNGIDLLIRADAPASTRDRTRLAAFAAAGGVARIAWAVRDGPPETAALVRTPEIAFAGVRVRPPPGAFLQASPQGQSAIVEAVLAGLPEAGATRAKIIELYAGVGTLSFPLATRSPVLAYEGDAPAAAALRRAAGGTRLAVTHRDLARQPLLPKEFVGATAVVLDPPFAGAGPQMAPLAAAKVPVVIIVSCHPAALAREAGLLKQNGYRLASATPIDQFLWSAQLESVCVFRLGRR